MTRHIDIHRSDSSIGATGIGPTNTGCLQEIRNEIQLLFNYLQLTYQAKIPALILDFNEMLIVFITCIVNIVFTIMNVLFLSKCLQSSVLWPEYCTQSLYRDAPCN